VVEQVIAKERRITIHHKEIPNFMPEMTMDFNVRDANQLEGVSPGAEVTFRLLVLQNDAWIENIRCVGHTTPILTNQTSQVLSNVPKLKTGDRWPDGDLLAEDGRRIHFSDFRGRTLALSFFFIRCPLPDYCPLMNRNFAEARKLFQSSPSIHTNYVFLSVSFDPDFDVPEKLASYAALFREGGSEQWLFAAVSPETLVRLPRRLGFSLKRQGASISHNLRTVVLDPQGRFFRQLDGNNWTPQELVEAMKEASQQPTSMRPP
jgi:protein SCO1/2